MTPNERWCIERLAHILYSRERLEEAKTLFEGITQLDPNASYAWYGLGLIARKRDDYALASDYLKHAQSLRPGDAAIRLARAEVTLKLGDREGTAAALDRIEGTDESKSKRRALVLRDRWNGT